MLDYPLTKLRVIPGPETLLGPGKADLLQGIEETASIACSECRQRMGIRSRDAGQECRGQECRTPQLDGYG